MVIPLTGLKIGMDGTIVRLDFDENIKERFIAMGIIPGKKITYVHESPFGDPMVFKIEDNKIMIRKDEAKKIFVEVSEELLFLYEANPGKYEVISLQGGLLFKKEIEKLNVKIGSKIEVISNNYGKLNIKVNGNNLLLGKGRARKILVRRL
ncbi:FeoA family protein [Marinitoga litoralis]|jgi:ferrous iron transport protein A|uniref:FeoA family protein n=1 Tax=Marinitoga litoralis TaxID=570855 RepID=UPI001961CA4E|nr:FeoA family protein [Marinitoga litoralis]MBM7558277.1 ferrous iron transport protein A [Marinitoga litoralis]